MDDSFEIPVHYKGQELLFPARLLHHGYTHQFAVEVNDQRVFFEPDEERNYRAMIDSTMIEGSHQLDINLLQAIAKAIETILK